MRTRAIPRWLGTTLSAACAITATVISALAIQVMVFDGTVGLEGTLVEFQCEERRWGYDLRIAVSDGRSAIHVRDGGIGCSHFGPLQRHIGDQASIVVSARAGALRALAVDGKQIISPWETSLAASLGFLLLIALFGGLAVVFARVRRW